MHLIHKLEVGTDVPEKWVNTESKRKKFIKSLKETTIKKLGLRPQDTQEVLIE